MIVIAQAEAVGLGHGAGGVERVAHALDAGDGFKFLARLRGTNQPAAVEGLHGFQDFGLAVTQRQGQMGGTDR